MYVTCTECNYRIVCVRVCARVHVHKNMSATYLPLLSLSGSSEMAMANAVQKLADKTPGKEARAMESFARALRQVKEL